MTYHLDFSTLSLAVKSENLELVEYLINYKKLAISDFDFLALKVALIESTDLYTYFIKLPECIAYLKNNSQHLLQPLQFVSQKHLRAKKFEP